MNDGDEEIDRTEQICYRKIVYQQTHTLGDTSAFVNPAGQLLLNRRGKTKMDGVSIVCEFYIDPL